MLWTVLKGKHEFCSCVKFYLRVTHDTLSYLTSNYQNDFTVVEFIHFSNGFDDLLNNEITTPELTIADTGRLLNITLSNDASTDARLDVYMANSLGHHVPGRIFSSSLPLTRKGESLKVWSQLLTFTQHYWLIVMASVIPIIVIIHQIIRSF